MLIGPAEGSSGISTATADSVTVRGHDLCGELIGTIGFTAYFHLLVTGAMPTAAQVKFLDAVMVAIAEHGLVPNVAAARMTFAADPNSLQGAVAAGLLGCGSVVLGTTESAGRMLLSGLERGCSAETLIEEYRATRKRLPGFGHPLHKPLDPRAQRLLALAEEDGVAGAAVVLARALDKAVQAGAKPLPMNVSLAIPAIMLDLGFPPPVLKGIPLLARTASLIAHLAEETKNPIGFLLADRGANAVSFREEG